MSGDTKRGLHSCPKEAKVGLALEAAPPSFTSPGEMPQPGFRRQFEEFMELASLNSDEALYGEPAAVTGRFNHDDFRFRYHVKNRIDLHGRVLPLIDLRKKLARYQGDGLAVGHVAVCNLEGKITGVILGVDWDIFRRTETVSELPPIIEIAVACGYAYGVARFGTRLLVWLDDSWIRKENKPERRTLKMKLR